MPISPNPAVPFEIGAASLNSIAQARQGLIAGFEQLGKQIRSDIGRIATTRQLTGFGQELATLNPQSSDFPQRAVGVMAKYPLAMNTPAGTAGINLLGRQHADWRQANTAVKSAVDWSLPGNNPIVGGRVMTQDPETGNYSPAGQSGGVIVQTETGPKLINRQGGAVIAEYGKTPVNARAAVNPRVAALNSAIKKQYELTLDQTLGPKEKVAADQQLNALQSQLDHETGQFLTRSFPDAGIRPSMGDLKMAESGFDSLGSNAVAPQVRRDVPVAPNITVDVNTQPPSGSSTPTPDQLPALTPGPQTIPRGPRGRKWRFDPESGKVIELQ